MSLLPIVQTAIIAIAILVFYRWAVPDITQRYGVGAAMLALTIAGALLIGMM
jgi:hypothetical protein